NDIAINHPRFSGSIPGNLFEVVTIFSPFPRVATASQPWASSGNGFAVFAPFGALPSLLLRVTHLIATFRNCTLSQWLPGGLVNYPPFTSIFVLFALPGRIMLLRQRHPSPS
ncbi:MAG: hypothetical protein LBM04_04705, partial [Opitutaceae bacterium]|nr:hypothetical protein [Opitutaceae bacterium]